MMPMSSLILAISTERAIGIVLVLVIVVGAVIYWLFNWWEGRDEIGAEVELVANRKPYLDDDELETKKLDLSLSLGLAFMLSVAAWPGADTAFLALAVGTVLLLAGAALKDKTAMFMGIASMLTGVMFGFDAIVRLIASSSWIELAVFGGAAIALASVLDRHGVSVQIRLRKWLDNAGLRHREIALDD